MADNSTSILAPFEKDTQDLLKEVDHACSLQMDIIREKARSASLANENLEITVEDMVWMKLIKSYGILFNRGVDAGWIEGVHTNDK